MRETRKRTQRTRGLGLVILVLASISVVVSARGIGGSDAERDRAYVEEISKNYDFKFGPNPFAPSNATSSTGTFIPGEKFIASWE